MHRVPHSVIHLQCPSPQTVASAGARGLRQELASQIRPARCSRTECHQACHQIVTIRPEDCMWKTPEGPLLNLHTRQSQLAPQACVQPRLRSPISGAPAPHCPRTHCPAPASHTHPVSSPMVTHGCLPASLHFLFSGPGREHRKQSAL